MSIKYFTLNTYHNTSNIYNVAPQREARRRSHPSPALQHTPPLRQHRILPLRPGIRMLELELLLAHARGPEQRLVLLAAYVKAALTQLLDCVSDGAEEAWFGRRGGGRGAVVVWMCVFDGDGPCAGLHEEMVAFCVDEPVHHELFPFWAAAAAAGEEVRWGGVDGEGEEIWGFREVGY